MIFLEKFIISNISLQGETGSPGPIGLTGPAGPRGLAGERGRDGKAGPGVSCPDIDNYHISIVNSYYNQVKSLMFELK